MKRMSHSKSTRVDLDHISDDDTGSKKKVKRSKSVFFDPTTKVSTPFPDLIWKFAFHKLPKSPQLTATTLTSDEVMDLLHCGLLSNAVYYKKSKRHLPPNLSNIVIECTVSDYYRVPYFVVDSEELDTIFIAFRGSSCLEDWHVDFLAAAIQFEHGHVHEGVYFTSLNIFNDFKDQIRDLWLNQNKRQIILTGHSLGGAVAGMMSILFNQEYSDMNVRSICLAPVACLSPEIWELSSSYIRTYINYGDLVPFISYYNTYYLPEKSLPKLTHDQLVNWCLKKINTHSKRPEFRVLVDTYTHPVSIPYKLIPPGISCLIRIVDKKAATVEIQAIEDPHSYFGQFVKNLSAMKHPIKFYKHSIIRFVCQFFDQDEKLINYYALSKRKSRKLKNPFRRRRKHKHHSKNKKNNENDENTTSSGQKNDSSCSLGSDGNKQKNSSSYSYENENNKNESSNDNDQNDVKNENSSDDINNKNESSSDDDNNSSSSSDDDDEDEDENNDEDEDENNDDDDDENNDEDEDEDDENNNDDDDDDGVEETYYKYE